MPGSGSGSLAKGAIKDRGANWVGHVGEHPFARRERRNVPERLAEHPLELGQRGPDSSSGRRQKWARRSRAEATAAPLDLAARIPDNRRHVHRPGLSERKALRLEAAD